MLKQNCLDRKEILQDSLEYFHLYNPGTAFWRGIEAACFYEVNIAPPVLDIGCADGAFGALSAHLLKSKTAGDFNKIDIGVDSSIDKFNYPGAYKYILKADATRLPFADAQFNTVISNCVIEHIHDIKSALIEISRVLKKDGRVYFSVPSIYFNKNLFSHSLFSSIGMDGVADKLVKRRNRKLLHFNICTIDEWQELLAKSGFKLLNYKYFISKKAQQIIFFIFDMYNIGIGRFTIGNVIRRLDLIAYNFFRKRPVSLISYRLFNNMFLNEFTESVDVGSELFIAAEKIEG